MIKFLWKFDKRLGNTVAENTVAETSVTTRVINSLSASDAYMRQ